MDNLPTSPRDEHLIAVLTKYGARTASLAPTILPNSSSGSLRFERERVVEV